MPTIPETFSFIRLAHAGQYDKASKPYWLHPLRVMETLPDDATEAEQHAALLHDVVEDTKYTMRDLELLGYSPEILEIVRLVTRFPDDERTYQQWVEGIADSGNLSAMRVKMADLRHNTERLWQLPKDKQKSLTKRYARAMVVIATGMLTHTARQITQEMGLEKR